MAEQRTAYLHLPALDNSRSYMGNTLTIPVGGGNTGGWLAVVEAKARPGSAAPPHVQEREDVLFRILEGGAAFYCGKERFVADAGDYVFLPAGVSYTMRFVVPSCG